MTASIVSLRATITADGATASASPPASAAARPSIVRSSHISAATSAMPPSAAGSSSATPSKPNSRVEATCSHRSTGGLSIATRPARARTRRSGTPAHEVPMLRTAAS